jgi:hypothetical protein
MFKWIYRIDLEAWLCIGFIAVVLCLAAYCDMRTEQRKTCESISVSGCQCPPGLCLCKPGGVSCPACAHQQTPEVEAVLQQERLREQAERAKR